MLFRLVFIVCFFTPALSWAQQASDSSARSPFYSGLLHVIDPARKTSKVNDSTAVHLAIGELLRTELPTQYEKFVSAQTRQMITARRSTNMADLPYEIHALITLERVVDDNDTINLHLKSKLVKEISTQVNLLMKDNYPGYNYNTRKKDIVKFISVRTGNDLFTIASLFLKPSKENALFFQPNRDRDYTGSLLIEVGTDFLSTQRDRPLKTYQTLMYGFDVYTPYFRDTAIFKTDTSFNPLDRPHASFQYIGWSKKGISLSDRYRWNTTLKVGKIGGHIGERFQSAIHQDVSYSPRPKGWGAQIANNGRFGISLEFKEEFWQVSVAKFATNGLYISGFAEQKVGTYMTNAGAGIKLTNKTFRETNANFISMRPRLAGSNIWKRLMYSAAFSSTYVVHNTMLEGYGIFNTTEKLNDEFTPRSRYFLKDDQVRRVTFNLNTTVSYTTRFITFFYNWFSFSPETHLGKIGIKSPLDGKEMDISKRWHHFAELGITFNIR